MCANSWCLGLYNIFSQCFRDSKFFQTLFWEMETAHIAPSSTSGYGRGKRGELYVVTLTVLCYVSLCKHNTSLIHNLTCLVLSDLSGGRSGEMFWDSFYITFHFGVIPNTPSTSCDLDQALFSRSSNSHFWYIRRQLSVAKGNPPYKSKFFCGRAFQTVCGNIRGLFVCLFYVCFYFLRVSWYSSRCRRQAKYNDFAWKLQHALGCSCVAF